VYIIKPSSPSRRTSALSSRLRTSLKLHAGISFPFSSVSRSSLYAPLSSTCAHSSDALAGASNIPGVNIIFFFFFLPFLFLLLFLPAALPSPSLLSDARLHYGCSILLRDILEIRSGSSECRIELWRLLNETKAARRLNITGKLESIQISLH